MTFLVLIPIMMLALVCAAVPLLVLTAREHRLRQVELRVNERNTAPGRRRPI